jgi:hypothetical protein
MPSSDGTEPIAETEVLYRRVPVSQGWYVPNAIPPLSPEAFKPRENDATGLSIYRAKYKALEQAAQGPSARGYYVAVLRASDLRSKGIDIVPRPEPGDPGHAEIPSLTYANRKTDRSLEIMLLLATAALRVEGPFLPHPRPQGETG